MGLRDTAIKTHWLMSSQLGIDVIRLFRSFFGVPRFVVDYFRFRRSYKGPLVFLPCLGDRDEESGAIKNEYFWQDLLVARWIFEACPRRHVDVGSRVDGFISHVASFREIEVIDIRPMTKTVPGIIFLQADIMRGVDGMSGLCDSLSCLHAIEHFGLGRYGDPIDPRGHEKGIATLAKMLAPGGRLYLSVPIGRERVEFNSHRVLDPLKVKYLGEGSGLSLVNLTVITRTGDAQSVKVEDSELKTWSMPEYNLGLFTFTRVGGGEAP